MKNDEHTKIKALVAVKLNGKRTVSGILRGFDPFMNLVVDEAVELRKDKINKPLGIVVISFNFIQPYLFQPSFLVLHLFNPIDTNYIRQF